LTFQQLEADSVIVVFGDARPEVLSNQRAIDLLSALTEEKSSRQAETVLAAIAFPDQRERFADWLANYDPPASFTKLAIEHLEQNTLLTVSNHAEVVATQRLRDWAYPLTVLGMVLAVGALGHLLQTPPQRRFESSSARRRRELCRATVISLALVALLSGLDLTWTLLSSRAGQMMELNPLGQQFIENPLLLAAFKGAATLGSCALLLALRRHQRAQLATWWMCLICTVLTFRWLVLHSLFVA
jgi:hypothetical protein